MEHSHYLDQCGMKWNGNNLYTILPMQKVVDTFHQQQLDQLEAGAQRRKLRRQQERRTRLSPPYAPASTCGSPIL